MLFARRKFRGRKSKKAKINPSVVVCSDDFLLLDLVEQFIVVCCCSALTYVYEDVNDVITTTAAAAKAQAIDRKERKTLRKNEINRSVIDGEG